MNLMRKYEEPSEDTLEIVRSAATKPIFIRVKRSTIKTIPNDSSLTSDISLTFERQQEIAGWIQKNQIEELELLGTPDLTIFKVDDILYSKDYEQCLRVVEVVSQHRKVRAVICECPDK